MATKKKATTKRAASTATAVDEKQTRAQFERTQAQRNLSEDPLDPAPDAPAMRGAEDGNALDAGAQARAAAAGNTDEPARGEVDDLSRREEQARAAGIDGTARESTAASAASAPFEAPSRTDVPVTGIEDASPSIAQVTKPAVGNENPATRPSPATQAAATRAAHAGATDGGADAPAADDPDPVRTAREARASKRERRRKHFEKESEAMIELLKERGVVSVDLTPSAGGIQIVSRLGGGGIRRYHGATLGEALAVMEDEMIHGPALAV